MAQYDDPNVPTPVPPQPAPPPRFKIEAIVTCVNYSDFLAYALPINKSIFDYMVVVTSSKDLDTQRLCESWGVRCFVTDDFYHEGAKFNKGRGINAGLSALSGDSWVCHLDADIVFPAHARQALQAALSDPHSIYGVDRVCCQDYEHWEKWFSKPTPQLEKDSLLHFGKWKPGARIVRFSLPGANGWLPIGFTQIWNPKASGIYRYPEEHTDAARGDVSFALRWPRERRRLIPDFIVYHLESDPNAEMGANWEGRRTPRFGPQGHRPKPGQPSRRWWQRMGLGWLFGRFLRRKR